MAGRNIEFRPLRRQDDRTAFSCGEASLDRFFAHYAGQNQFKLHLAVTWVAVVDERILGFATLTAGSIERDSLPGARLRKRLPAYPLPVLRIARLGVDVRAKGHGIGKAILRRVFLLAIEQRDRLGCVGVVVDAKPEAEGFYESLGFLPLATVRQGALHGGLLPMFLPLASIAQATGRAPD